ncbi:FliO/MopB family protein [Myxococcota bacterium]
MSPLVSYLIETVVTLTAISGLAVLVLFGVRRVGLGRPTGPLDLMGRLPLEGRRAVYLVRIGETVYVLGASEAGLQKLGELERGAIGTPAASDEPTFRQVLSRVLRADGTRSVRQAGDDQPKR